MRACSSKAIPTIRFVTMQFPGSKHTLFSSMWAGSTSKMFSALFLVMVSIFSTMTSAQEIISDERALDPLQAVASSNLKFTNSIYKILSEKEGNFFFSPISIEVILALTYFGARGTTASQMSDALNLPKDDNVVELGFKSLVNQLKGDENFTLEIANSIFADKSLSLKNEFQTLAQNSFASDLLAVDFRTNYEATRLQINQWVESKTNDKIKDLLAQGTITSQTALVLVNAIFFKSGWAQKFNASNTRPEKFFVTPTMTKKVQMMNTRAMFAMMSMKVLDCKVLELPYRGDRLSFVVFLPNEVDGLAELEANLPSVDWNQLMGRHDTLNVEVSLPKFKLAHSIELNDVLKQLGMVGIFEDTADFSGLSQQEVKVSKVVHKAFIEVNEEGTEASAATAVASTFKSMFPRFEANHPFMFAIVDKRLRTTLFVGRYVG